MNWSSFPLFSLIALSLWLAGSLILVIKKEKSIILPILLYFAGIVVFLIYIILLWQYLDRPPMRTLGETRLWYALFLPIISLIIYLRWRYLWMLWYGTVLSIVFISINYLHPETHDKTLMPALQSPWFIPHVMVYIFAYALLGASSLFAVFGLYKYYYQKKIEQKELGTADNLVYIGFAFLTFGLIFGALWAKEAWGHYWTWDPKETWALLTWISYLLYIHYRYYHSQKPLLSLWTLSLAFVILLICWFGINYLPAAQSSVHVYSD